MKLNVKSNEDRQSSKTDGCYVLIEEIEASLHVSENAVLFKRISERIKRLKRSINKHSEDSQSVVFFVASGSQIDEKVDSINRRIKRK